MEVDEVISREVGDKVDNKRKLQAQAEDHKEQVKKQVEEALRKESARVREQEEMAAKWQQKLASKEEENNNLKLAQERARFDSMMAHMAEMEAIRKQAEQDKELMANAAQRARAEGELGIMKQLQEQHLLEQQRWQKRDKRTTCSTSCRPSIQMDKEMFTHYTRLSCCMLWVWQYRATCYLELQQETPEHQRLLLFSLHRSCWQRRHSHTTLLKTKVCAIIYALTA
ncbi:hypothetical protein AB1Y20_008641 [Prymnesium parvum]|uniref:Meiosis-specific nuclear structural protein 1 n=1 Tax=Prymnesium parvum TaxID=97485 RepID=A0AB34IQX0_PRYPA